MIPLLVLFASLIFNHLASCNDDDKLGLESYLFWRCFRLHQKQYATVRMMMAQFQLFQAPIDTKVTAMRWRQLWWRQLLKFQRSASRRHQPYDYDM